MDRRRRLKLRALGGLLVLVMMVITLVPASAVKPAPVTIDPKTIPQFVNQLTGPPPVYTPTNILDANNNIIRQDYTVTMTTNLQQILPAPMPKTPVWSYSGLAHDAVSGANLGVVANSPAPTFEATRGIPSQVTWINSITANQPFAVDPTIGWADPNNLGMVMPPYPVYPPGYPLAQSNQALVPHLHGGEVQSYYDGGPNSWFTATGTHGMTYNTAAPTLPNQAIYDYPNAQPAGTLWYHDHAMGETRLTVMCGLAGFYLLRDNNQVTDPIAPLLPSGKYEVPLAIQDRTFNLDGSLFFPSVGLNPGIHPYWMPEFFGDTIMVNGMAWPNMNVDKGQYRFRLLDGSNARFYTLSLSLSGQNGKIPFKVIGSDDAYLKTAALMDVLTISPGERYDILVDFSAFAAGTKIVMTNSAKAPFPNGAPADPQTTGVVMQFTVGANAGHAAAVLPANLNPTLAAAFPTLGAPTNTRYIPFFEIQGPAGPQMLVINGLHYESAITELPKMGATEDWVIINPTADVHPIHLHLVQFQLISRQPADTAKYQTDWLTLNGGVIPLPMNTIPQQLAVLPYLKGKPTAALPEETGWKDTIKMWPGTVTTIRVRFSPTDGSAVFPFDPTQGPGYVWHCHILDHEDNEFMRPYKVAP